jgi:hypothetical protein
MMVAKKTELRILTCSMYKSHYTFALGNYDGIPYLLFLVAGLSQKKLLSIFTRRTVASLLESSVMIMEL